MTRIELNLSSEYGVMFLHDAAVTPSAPKDAGTKPVTWTSSCLAFNILIHVDGDAKVILSDGSDGHSWKEYFSGKINCPSKALSLTDHNEFAFASVPLEDSFAKISLRMSEEKNPDVVECAILNMKTY